MPFTRFALLLNATPIARSITLGCRRNDFNTDGSICGPAHQRLRIDQAPSLPTAIWCRITSRECLADAVIRD